MKTIPCPISFIFNLFFYLKLKRCFLNLALLLLVAPHSDERNLMVRSCVVLPYSLVLVVPENGVRFCGVLKTFHIINLFRDVARLFGAEDVFFHYGGSNLCAEQKKQVPPRAFRET